MQQKELFPENKIFSHQFIVYWLVILTVGFLFFVLIMLISFIISPGGSSQSSDLGKLKIEVAALTDQIEKITEKFQKIESIAAEKNSAKKEENPPAAVLNTSIEWPLYESTNYKFSLKYPENWKSEKKSTETTSKVNPEIKISMVAFISPANSKLIFLPEGEFDRGISTLPLSSMKITLGGQEATKSIYPNGLTVIIFDNFHNFRIEYEEFQKTDTEIVENILKTLQFS